MSSPSAEDRMLDGNAIGGMLSEIFVADLTAAIVECAKCGQIGSFARTHVYNSAGIIVRCPDCGEVLIAIVRSHSDTRLSFRNIANLRILSSPANDEDEDQR